jgi:hypothetical protein
MVLAGRLSPSVRRVRGEVMVFVMQVSSYGSDVAHENHNFFLSEVQARCECWVRRLPYRRCDASN